MGRGMRIYGILYFYKLNLKREEQLHIYTTDSNFIIVVL